MKPIKIEVMPFGFRAYFKLKTVDYNKKLFKANLLELKKLIVAASGPAMNLFIIFAIIIIKQDFYNKLTIIYANILIIIFNLLPIYPLDGGRILQSVVHIFFRRKESKNNY